MNKDLSGVENEGFLESFESSFQPPIFTIKELRDSVPSHLLNKSYVKSFYYLTFNVLQVSTIFYFGIYIHVKCDDRMAIILWPLYWWFQGIAAMGLWVLAHECGHNAFTESSKINHLVGYVLHTFLLVPYFSWRITHSQHHSSAGHLLLDQGYLPKRRSQIRPEPLSPWKEAFESSPISVMGTLIMYLLLGWPSYLLFHTSGRNYGQFATHFTPTSPVFQKKHAKEVWTSNMGILVMLVSLYICTELTSGWTVMKFYWVPYLLVNAWVVTITLLQHTDVYIPHYPPETWTYVKGALATVDRDYGWFLNSSFHHIQDSHVAHHVFTRMPFYNAVKATPYLRTKLGEYYLVDPTPFWKALYRVVRDCVFVENSGDVLFYRKN